MAIEEELSLRIEDALAAIDQVAKSLTDAATTFFVAMDDALKAISANPVALPIEAAFTEVEGGDLVQAAIGDEQETSLTFTDVDADAVREGTQDSLDSVTPDPIQIPIDGDASALGEAVSEGIQGASGDELIANIFMESVNPTQPAEEVKEAFDEQEYTVTPVIDSSGLDQVSESAGGAGDNIGKVAENTEKAKKETEELSALSLGLAIGFKGITAAAVAGTAAISGFFAAAVASEGATIAFNQTLGSLAPAINNVDVNGLNINLQDLAETLGSDDEAVLNVAQRFGQLGITSGAAAEEIATANNQLFAVAASIRATNPALGDLDQVASKAGQAFIRGGRAAAGLGISLSSAEIKARAAERTGKDINATFSQFELFAAGASLASEKFGDSVEQNIDNALQNPIIALESIREIFSNTIEELGAPLVVPVLELIRNFLPIAQNFADVLGELAIAFLPVVTEVFSALQPILENISLNLNELVGKLSGTFDALGESLRAIVVAATPFVNFALEGIIAALEGLLFFINPIIEAFTFFADSVLLNVAVGILALNVATKQFTGSGLVGLFQVLAPLTGRLGAISVGITNATNAASLALSTYSGLIPVIAAVAVGIGFLIQKALETPPVFEDVIESTLQTASAVLDLESAILSYRSALSDYITQTEVLKDEDLVSALSETGLSVEDFTKFVKDGEDGLRSFVQFLAASTEGGLRSYQDGVRYTAEEVANLNDEQVRQLFLSRDTDGALNTLGDRYNDIAGSYNSTNEAAFNLLIAQEGLGEQTRREALATAGYADNQINYGRALDYATQQVVKKETAERRQAIASGEATKELATLNTELTSYRQQLALGVDATSLLSQATVTFNDDADAAKKFIEEITAELETFSQTVLANVPSVIDAFSELSREEGGSFDEISASLQKNLDDTQNWSNTLVRLSAENKTGILQVAAEIGPERTAILLEAYQGDETALEQHLTRMLELENNARIEAEVASKIGYAKINFLNGVNYDALKEQLKKQAFWGPITKEEFDAAIAAVQEKNPVFESAAVDAGERGFRGFYQGFRGLGAFDKKDNPLSEQIENQGQQAQDTAKQQGNAAGQAYIESAGTTVAANGGVLSTNLATTLAAASNATEFFARLIGIFSAQRIVNGFVETLLSNTFTLVQTLNTVLLNASLETSFGSQYVGFVIASNIGRGAYDNRTFIGDELVRAFTFVVENYSDEADMTGWYLGDALVEGLKRGLRDGASDVGRIAAEIIAGAEAEARDEAQSDSPSRVWEQIGQDLVSGLTRGLETGTPAAFGAASSLMQRVNSVPLASGGNTSISVNVPVTINGNADPSMGAQIGRAAAVELRRVLQLEARMA